jgi:hypothetical protein
MTDRARYTLVLVDAAGPDMPPSAVRLRMVLKALGRRYGLRCVTILPGDEPDRLGRQLREARNADRRGVTP